MTTQTRILVPLLTLCLMTISLRAEDEPKPTDAQKDTTPMPDIAGKWRMGKDGEFGVSKIVRTVDNSDVAFEYVSGEVKILLRWNAPEGRFEGDWSSPDGTGKVALKPIENASVLKFSVLEMEDAARKKIAQRIASGEVTEQVVKSLYNHEWRRVGKAKSVEISEATSRDGTAVGTPDSNSAYSNRIVIPLEYADAAEVSRKLNRYYKDGDLSSVDAATNAVILRDAEHESKVREFDESRNSHQRGQSPDQWLQQVSKAYDQQERRRGRGSASPTSSDPAVGQEDPSNPTMPRTRFEVESGKTWISFSSIDPTDPVQLTARIHQHEAEAHKLAQQMRLKSRDFGQNHPEVVELRKQLETELQAALALKFQREELQVTELQNRLRAVTEQIQRRKAVQQKILDRKLQELLGNGDTAWEDEASGERPEARGSIQRNLIMSPVLLHTDALTAKTEAIPPRDRLSARIRLTGPKGLMSQPFQERPGVPLPLDISVALPATEPLQLQLVEGDRVFHGSITLTPVKAHTRFFWESNVIPFDITDADWEAIVTHGSLIKVAYLSEASIKLHREAKVEYVTSTTLQRTDNPLKLADDFGAVLAVLRLYQEAFSSPAEGEKALIRRSERNSEGQSSPKRNGVSFEPKLSLDEPPQPANSPNTAVRLMRAMDAVAVARKKLERIHDRKDGGVGRNELEALAAEQDQAQLALKTTLEEYKVELRDLELQVEAAEAEFNAAAQRLQIVEKLKSNISTAEFEATEQRRRQAEISLKRLQNRYDFYKKAGENVLDPPTNPTPQAETPAY